jgi:hypothetical protein
MVYPRLTTDKYDGMRLAFRTIRSSHEEVLALLKSIATMANGRNDYIHCLVGRQVPQVLIEEDKPRTCE